MLARTPPRLITFYFVSQFHIWWNTRTVQFSGTADLAYAQNRRKK